MDEEASSDQKITVPINPIFHNVQSGSSVPE
jgi:hypothetical protein